MQWYIPRPSWPSILHQLSWGEIQRPDCFYLYRCVYRLRRGSLCKWRFLAMHRLRPREIERLDFGLLRDHLHQLCWGKVQRSDRLILLHKLWRWSLRKFRSGRHVLLYLWWREMERLDCGLLRYHLRKLCWGKVQRSVRVDFNRRVCGLCKVSYFGCCFT